LDNGIAHLVLAIERSFNRRSDIAKVEYELMSSKSASTYEPGVDNVTVVRWVRRKSAKCFDARSKAG
jgi:hypothetical protein